MAGRRSTTDDAPKGIHDSEPLKKVVGSYPERPYAEAISDSHRARLAEQGIEVPKSSDASAQELTTDSATDA